MSNNLVDEARRITKSARPEGSWQRAAALLLRQAIEETAASYWTKKRVAGLANAKQRHQLISLPFYLRTPDGLAHDIRYAWNRLSVACHAGTRIILPTADELRALADVVEQFERQVAAS